MNKAKWKRTKEELPEEYSKVFFYSRKIGVEIGEFRGSAFHYDRLCFCQEPKELVTHWLYYPNIPSIKKIVKNKPFDISITSTNPEIRISTEE